MSDTSTTTLYVTSKVLPLGEGSVFVTYEGIGLVISDTGGGLFHNATVRSLGSMKIEKGVIRDERGWVVFNLQTGDKVFFTYTMTGEVKQGGVGFGKGTGTITGGTGKAAGIQGSFEMTRTVVRSSVEGVGQNYIKSKMKYTLP